MVCEHAKYDWLVASSCALHFSSKAIGRINLYRMTPNHPVISTSESYVERRFSTNCMKAHSQACKKNSSFATCSWLTFVCENLYQRFCTGVKILSTFRMDRISSLDFQMPDRDAKIIIWTANGIVEILSLYLLGFRPSLPRHERQFQSTLAFRLSPELDPQSAAWESRSGTLLHQPWKKNPLSKFSLTQNIYKNKTNLMVVTTWPVSWYISWHIWYT